MERLTFNIGTSRGSRLVVAGRADAPPAAARTTTPGASTLARAKRQMSAVRERYDTDYLFMLAFTALLFFRPQDHIPGLGALHLAELTAIGGLAAMAVRRLSAGQTIAHVNGEVVARDRARRGDRVDAAVLLLAGRLAGACSATSTSRSSSSSR